MEHSCTRPLDVDDTIALVGIVAALEALISSGSFADGEIAALRQSLELGGAVLPDAGPGEITAALSALNTRLRATID